MAQYTYITLNDGTKWRIKGNVQPQGFSGPYRQAEVVDENKTKSTAATGSKPAKTYAASSSAAKTTAAEAAAAKAREEAKEREKIRREKENAINAAKEKELDYLTKGFDAEKSVAKLAADNNMRELYIAYMQGLKGMPQQSALWGAGGEIESLKNRSRLNYEDNRAKESRNYAGILGEIQQKYNDDLRELEEKYLQRLLNI